MEKPTTLLGGAPSLDPPEIKKISTALIRKPLEVRFSNLKAQREPWMRPWKAISENIVPLRGPTALAPNRVRLIDHKIVMDGHASIAVRTLAAGISSGLTSQAKPWFKIAMTDKSLMVHKEVKEWLEIVETMISSVFQKSNIYTCLTSIYAELGAFGTAACLIVEDYHTVIRAHTFTAGDYFLGCSADGRVDTFARESWYTVGQLVTEFGYENCSPATQAMYNNDNIDNSVQFVHLIEPNDTRIDGKIDFNNKLYRSVYWEIGSPSDTFLRTSGFDDFPVLAPRWDLVKSSDHYGTSCGWEALGDVKMLHRLQRDKFVALDKVVNPPVMYNASIEGRINLTPGGITKYSADAGGKPGLQPLYQVNPDFQAIEMTIEKTKASISKVFYSDLFLAISQLEQDSSRTATEVNARTNEALLQLGPVLGRLESELLTPLIDRTFNIMLRNQLFPPPPPIIDQHFTQIEYTSILAQAQKAVNTVSIQQTTAFMASMFATSPEIADVFNFDAALRKYGEFIGVPASILRSPDETAKLREERQKAAAQQQMLDRTHQLVDSAKKLGDTQMGQDSALDRVLKSTANNSDSE